MTMPKARCFTGRHMLVWVLAFFGVVTLVNAVMIWFALTSHHEVLRRTSMTGPVPALERESTSWPT